MKVVCLSKELKGHLVKLNQGIVFRLGEC